MSSKQDVTKFLTVIFLCFCVSLTLYLKSFMSFSSFSKTGWTVNSEKKSMISQTGICAQHLLPSLTVATGITK